MRYLIIILLMIVSTTPCFAIKYNGVRSYLQQQRVDVSGNILNGIERISSANPLYTNEASGVYIASFNVDVSSSNSAVTTWNGTGYVEFKFSNDGTARLYGVDMPLAANETYRSEVIINGALGILFKSSNNSTTNIKGLVHD